MGREEMLDLVARLGGARHLGAARHPPARRRAAGVRPRGHARRRPAGRLRAPPAPCSSAPGCSPSTSAPTATGSSPGSPSGGSTADRRGRARWRCRSHGDDDIDTRPRRGRRPRPPAAPHDHPPHLPRRRVPRPGRARLMTGAVYDRGYRGLRGRARRPRRRPGRRCSAPRCAAPSGSAGRGGRRWRPFVLLGHRHGPRHRLRRRRLRHARHARPPTSSSSPTASTSASRTSLLVFVALTAPDIMCPDRRQRVLPARSSPGRSPASTTSSPRSARCSRSSSRSRSCRRWCSSSARCSSATTGRSSYARDNAEVIWQVPVAVALLSLFYAVDRRGDRVADVAPDHRRRVDHRALPRHVDRGQRPRRASETASESERAASSGAAEHRGDDRGRRPSWSSQDGELRGRSGDSILERDPKPAALINLLDAPARAPRPRVPRRGRGRRTRCRGWPTAACTRSCSTLAVVLVALRASCSAATTRSSGDAICRRPRRRRLRRPLDPAFVADATVTATDVSVWFGQKVALSELSCSFGPGVTGLLGPNGAGKTTLMRAITGLIPVNQGQVHGRRPLAPRATGRSTERLALVPEDEAVPRGLTPRQLCTLRRRPPRHHRPQRRRLGAADRRHGAGRRPQHGRLQQGHAPAQQGGGRPREEPARARARRAAQRRRPGAAPPPHRAVPTARRRGPHRHRQLARPQRGRVDGRPGDRVVRGRLAAAGGHRAIRDAMDDVPRQRARPGARAGGGWPPRCSATTSCRASTSTATTSSSPPPGPRSSPCSSPRPPATSACTSSRSAPSTTRSRACSGSSCDDRHRHDRPRRRPALLAPRRLHAPAVPAGQALDRRAGPGRGVGAVRVHRHAPSTTPPTRAFAGRGGQRAVRPRAAGDVPGDRRRRARRGGAIGHVHVHLDVAGADLADRRRPLAGRHASPRPGALAVAFALAAVVAGAPESAGAIAVAGRLRRRRPTSPCSSPSAASPSAPRSGRSPSCSSSSGCSGAASAASPSSAPSWEARAAFVGLTDAQRGPRPRGHPPRHRRPRPPLLHLRRRPRPRQLAGSAPSSSPAAAD